MEPSRKSREILEYLAEPAEPMTDSQKLGLWLALGTFVVLLVLVAAMALA